MKVAILFWGLTRSVKYTIKSIEDSVYSKLKDADISFDIFVHTYSISGSYVNGRARERIEEYSHLDYSLLKPNFIKIDNRENILKEINTIQYRTHPDPWNTNYQTVDNFILAMYSKKQVTQMMIDTGNIYDKVLFLRPDVKYLVPFNPKWITDTESDNKLLIPNFHIFSGMNDRMACCSLNISKIYGTIFDIMLEYSKKRPLHSESIHKFLMDLHKIPIVKIPFYFNRVRCDGREQKDCNI